ncbi:S-adenosyl-L-methionine-dependent methyltransferase [Apiospora kogelbergensis]|uniref:S-adenosyl-L-methionine-dependent methyltransferase n=1 Tax=Apiospora kogelbergensis TaxID=1337665 RepID=UPI00312F9D04
MATPTTFDGLAATISKNAAIAAEYLRQNNLPTPSLLRGEALDTSSLPAEIQAACVSLQSASLELHDLVQGPRAILMNFSTNAKADAASIFQFALPQRIPLDSAEGITYAELAQQTGLGQSALETILRAAIMYRVFREPSQGRVAHSAASRLWAADSVLNDVLGLKILDNGLHVQFIAQALERHPQADEPANSAASVLHAALEGKGEKEQRATWFEILEREPARSGRARTAMNMMDKRDGVSLRYLADGYDWASLPKDSLVVDLGGGHGDAVVAIANRFPHLKFQVQDLPQTIATAPESISQTLPVEFLAHSFLDPQPTKDAQVYLFRWVFHNWPDKYCVRILKTLVPALRKGARVLIMDSVMPPVGGVPRMLEREKRYMDLVMLANFNARDRPAEAYESLFTQADERFEFLGIKSVEGSELCFIEASWKG